MVPPAFWFGGGTKKAHPPWREDAPCGAVVSGGAVRYLFSADLVEAKSKLFGQAYRKSGVGLSY
jgi:hypothetical protein